ncbi:MAG: polymerase subunit sigma-70 [Gemmatimonadetes bacterium]|nr:polymerase subunit sigma-70 [Gemmatimonadota bacterium]
MLGVAPDLAARDAIERAARDSYGRLLAYLSARSHDVMAAEDALADAFHKALESWPHSGVPAKPEAWLLVTARRKLIDVSRMVRRHEELAPALLAVADEAVLLADSDSVFPDERLELLFVCAHPAIDAAVRTPLVLQTILGLDAARIASAFVVKPSTMGQRLSRAKAKIRDARIAFAVPEASQLPERLDTVMETIYATYGTGWDDVAGADERRRGLATEAITLGRLLVALMPDEPEALGLLALMLFCEARRDARRGGAGEYVPLSEQDVTLWSRPMLDEAAALLSVAERLGRIGHFQLEAAIQRVHARRAVTGATDWEEIALLYEGVVQLAPTIGALVGRAAAVAEARGAELGLTMLRRIPADAVASYQPFWALAAHLHRAIGREEAARDAFDRAIGLCEDAAMRDFLLRKAATP